MPRGGRLLYPPSSQPASHTSGLSDQASWMAYFPSEAEEHRGRCTPVVLRAHISQVQPESSRDRQSLSTCCGT